MRALLLCALLVLAASSARAQTAATPESQGLDTRALVRLTNAVIADAELPIYSILISRHGKLVYELYTSDFSRDDAHYVMSVTKSVTSLLIGAALDRHLIRDVDQSVVELLPPSLFANAATRARLLPLTVKDVLGMSALDAPIPPHDKSPAAAARQRAFWAAPDRVKFALAQPLLPSLGSSFQYQDITPMLATAILEHVTHQSVFAFATDVLFTPLGFRNVEWMHQDQAGHDNAAYGLRLRPIDMQKLGILVAQKGKWDDRQVISAAWIARIEAPFIKSTPTRAQPNYGWYFWLADYGTGWIAHEMNGWKGQRIDYFPSQDVVVTMTACLEDDVEFRVFALLLTEHIMPALTRLDGALPENLVAQHELETALHKLNASGPRVAPSTEWRMVPSHAPKERRRALALDNTAH